MKFINPMFKTRKIKGYINELINIYGYTSFDDLCYADKCEFASLIIDAYDKHSEHEFFTESSNVDQAIAAFKRALRGNEEDDRNFIAILKENTVTCYQTLMRALFDEMYEYCTQSVEDAA